jgi:hypothetical protein
MCDAEYDSDQREYEQIEQEKLTRWNERNRLAIEQSEKGLSRPLDDERVLARLREAVFARMARRGLDDSDAGSTLSDDEVRRTVRSWRKWPGRLRPHVWLVVSTSNGRGSQEFFPLHVQTTAPVTALVNSL